MMDQELKVQVRSFSPKLPYVVTLAVTGSVGQWTMPGNVMVEWVQKPQHLMVGVSPTTPN